MRLALRPDRAVTRTQHPSLSLFRSAYLVSILGVLLCAHASRSFAQAGAEPSANPASSQDSASSRVAEGDEGERPTGETPQGGEEAGQATQGSAQGEAVEQVAPSNQEKRTVGAEKRLPSDRVPPRQRASSRGGLTGLREVISADTGAQGTLRFGLTGSGFSTSEFLTKGVKERFTRLDLSVAYSPLEFLEVALNTRALSYQNPLASPSHIQGIGDLSLVAKGGYFWGIIGAGLSLGAQFVSDPAGGGWLGEATNLDLHGLFTVDMNRGEAPFPFRFFLDVQFTKENTEALTANLSEEPSLIQEWGYQSARYDRLMLNFGIEVPTEYVSPFAEYHIGTPFLVEMPRMGKYSRVFAFESVPHYLAGGVRGYPRPELAVELGGTLGMSDAPFTGVTATPPWTVWGGVTYTLDPRPEVIEREVKVEPPPPPKPEPPKPLGVEFALKVLDAETKEPIQGATLTFTGIDLSAQVSDAEGQLSGYRLPAGAYRFEVSAQGYTSKKSGLKISEDRAKDFKGVVRLKPDPFTRPATLDVSLEADERAGAARLELTLYGPETHKATLTVATPLKWTLKPGEYVLVLRDEKERSHEDFITLGGGGKASRVIQLGMLRGDNDAKGDGAGAEADAESEVSSDRPVTGKTKHVVYDLKKKRISTRRRIDFDGESARLTKGSEAALSGLAEFLKEERRIERIVVIVHTHSRGDTQADKRLGAQRASAIKTVLTRVGVESSRVSILNYGSDKSVSSNLTRQGRQRNQRVLFMIKSVKL